VTLKVAATTHKTRTVMKSLAPVWNEEFDFAVGDADADVLFLQVFDFDKHTRNDKLGSVEIPLRLLSADDSRREDGSITITRDFHLQNVKHGSVNLTLTLRPPLAESRHVKVQNGTLEVRLLKAAQLVAKDIGGSSDPYCTLSVGKTKQRSKVVKKSLEPVFDQSFRFSITDASKDEIVLEMFDWDRVGKNDKLGDLVVPVASIAGDNSRKEDGSVKVTRCYTLENAKHGMVYLEFVLRPKSKHPILQTGSLIVTLKHASQLVAADVGGKSDPFCELSLGSETVRSKTMKSTLEPVWNETFTFHVADVGAATLDLACFDWDRVGNNDKLGTVSVPIADIAADDMREKSGRVTVDRDFALEGAKHGVVTLHFDLQPVSTNPVLQSGTLIMTLHEGVGLVAADAGGTSDPFAEVRVGQTLQKTKVIKKSLNPAWEEKFQFGVANTNTDAVFIRVSDWDRFSANDSLGEVTIPLLDIARENSRDEKGEVSFTRTFSLSNAKHGALRITFQLRAPPPACKYAPLDRGRLLVTIQRGEQLVAADVGGSSDPFVEISMGRKTFKTQVKKKTLEPKWNEKFTFNVRSVTTDLLQLRVKDWDRVGAADALGDISIPVTDVAYDNDRKPNGAARVQRKLVLQNAKHGVLHVLLELQPPPVNSHYDIVKSGIVVVTAVRASNLIAADVGGKSDPYLTLRIGAKTFRTQVRRKTLAPVWKETFKFSVTDISIADLEVCAFDQDRVGNDDSLGSLIVPLDDIAEHDSRACTGAVLLKDQRCTLTGVKHGQVGSITIAYVFVNYYLSCLCYKHSHFTLRFLPCQVHLNIDIRPRSKHPVLARAILSVTVHRGDGLIRADQGGLGKSDPFCQVCLLSRDYMCVSFVSFYALVCGVSVVSFYALVLTRQPGQIRPVLPGKFFLFVFLSV
jgi:Ca2+-dependent lipid-binding protein